MMIYIGLCKTKIADADLFFNFVSVNNRLKKIL